ncbi:MAG: hypothetical protein Q8R39_00100, partial [bacterium]|nr:hypothetical protein [bacterium]
MRTKIFFAGVIGAACLFTVSTGIAHAQVTTVTPTPGPTPLTSSMQTFTWNAVLNTVDYWVYLGTTQGGKEIVSTGQIGNVTTYTTTQIPLTGGVVWLRVWYKDATTGTWQFNDFSYTTSVSGATTVTTITPTPGPTPLTSSMQTFTWNAVLNTVDYWVYLGTTQGGKE